MLKERATVRGGSKWLKNLVDGGSERMEVRKALTNGQYVSKDVCIEIDFIDTLSTERGKS
jgi:hypothetical protein